MHFGIGLAMISGACAGFFYVAGFVNFLNGNFSVCPKQVFLGTLFTLAAYGFWPNKESEETKNL